MADKTHWSEVSDQILTDRWSDPTVTTRDIGLAVGCSRTTVMVRAKVLGLGPRPQGMNRFAPGRNPGHTRIRLGEPLVPVVGGGADFRGDTLSKLRPDWFRPCEPRPAQPGGPAKTCRWVTTDGRPWMFCDAPSEQGWSYCPTHKEIVYRPYEPQLSGG